MAYLGHRPAVGENNSFRILDDISSYVLTFDGSSASAVSLSNETITMTEDKHRYITGQRVTYSNGGGGNITGLTNGQAYFVINHSSTEIKLASSASNALAGTAVDLTGLGTGSSHTLTLAFDGVNTKFVPTFGNGLHDTLIKRAAQLVISLNGVIQQPHDTATPTTGFGVDALGNLIFSTAPASTDIFWAHVLASNTVTFDSSDNDVDTFTGDGSTTSFTLSKVPPDNRNILVTIDGVVQYPSDAANTRSYNVSENVMTFVAAPGNGTVIQVRHIGYAGPSAGGGGGGVTGFYGRTGNVSLQSTDNIVANDAVFNGNVSIAKTLTYEDVTDIDSVGLITARSGIKDQTLTAGRIVYVDSDKTLTDNANLTFDGNRVRIGTTSNRPAYANEPGIVFGDNTAGTAKKGVASFCADGAAPLLLTRRVSDGNVLGIADDDGTKGLIRVNSDDLEITAIEELRLSTGAGHDEKVRLKNNGRVGIGTDDPKLLLHLHQGNSNATFAHFTNTTTGINANQGVSFGLDSDENAVIYHYGSKAIRFATDGDERLRIKSDGEVLLGTGGVDRPVAGQRFNSGNGWGGSLQIEKPNPNTFNNNVPIVAITAFNGANEQYTGGISFNRSNSNTQGTQGAVNTNQQLGNIAFNGSDGTNFIQGAEIFAIPDQTFATNDGPASLVFATTPDGTSEDEPQERLRITSGGLIQTKTRVATERRVILSGSPSNSSFNIEAHDGSQGIAAGTVQGELGLYYNDGTTLSDTATIKFERGSGAPDGAMTFFTNNNERLRIDSTGALGLGVGGITSYFKNNSGNYRQLQIGLGAHFYGRTDDTPIYLVSNGYRDGSNWKYTANTTASQIAMGTHIVFETAGAGTAGNNISFNERLRITSEGYVHLGNSGHGTNKVGGQAVTGEDFDPYFKLYASTSNHWLMHLRSDTATGSNGIFMRAGNNSNNYSMYITARDEHTPHFVVRGDGKVGVGTATVLADSKVHICDSSASNYRSLVLDSSATNGSTMIYKQNGSQVIAMGSGGGNNLSGSDVTHGLIRSEVATVFAVGNSEKLRITSGGVIQTGSKTITGGNNLAIQNFAVKGVWSGANSIGKSIELISGYDSAVKMTAIGYNLTDTDTGSTYGGDLTFHTQPLYGSPTTPLPVRMRISSSGYVTQPQQPAFSVHSGVNYYTHGTDTGTLNVTTLATVLFDTTSSYDTGTNIYTAPVSGKYFMTFMFAYKSTSGYLNVKLSKAVGSGSFGTYGRMFSGPPQQSSLYNNGQAVIGVMELDKGDRVRPQVEVNYSGNQLVNCHWSGYLLG